MRLAVFTIAMVLLATSAGFAQAETECPTIVVVGPAGIPYPDEPVKFTVEVKGVDPRVMQYRWTLSNGHILEGQGTPTITVTYDKDGASVTATAEVAGLAEGCPNRASETLSYCILPVPELIAEGSVPVTSIDKPKLNKLAAQLAMFPNSQGYLIEYFPPGTSQRTIDAKTRLIIQQMKKLVDESRITIVRDTSSKPLTRYFIVPPGADNPTP